jgi:hypothetical protein
VDFMRAALRGEPKQRNQAMTLSIALIVLGVLLIVTGALTDWGWTRVIGATIITVGGIGAGVLLGLIPTRREAVLARLRQWRSGVIALAVIVLVLPILIALAASVIGAFLHGGGAAAAHVLGTLIGVLLFAAVAASAWIGVRAAIRATETNRQIGEPKEEAA